MCRCCLRRSRLGLSRALGSVLPQAPSLVRWWTRAPPQKYTRRVRITASSTSGGGAFGAACEIAVVVPALDEEQFLGDCLGSLAAQRERDRPFAPDRFAVVIVDNGSVDGTAHVARRFAAAHPTMRIDVVAEPRPGVAIARRTGFDWAAERLRSGRVFVASTDADTRVPSRWLEGILDTAAREPTARYFGGSFTYDAPFLRLLDRFAHTASVWRRLNRVVAPLQGVETVGSNFAVERDAYRALAPMPLFTVGEDLAFGELCVARGFRGAWLPHAVITSERRAIGDPRDFLTGDRRMAAWGQHGRDRFQPFREKASGDPFANIAGSEERELVRRCLRYFVRHHVVKPLVLVPALREPTLKGALGLCPNRFSALVEARLAARAPLHDFTLEDVVLDVDAAAHGEILAALEARIERAADGEGATNDVPFHCRGAVA